MNLGLNGPHYETCYSIFNSKLILFKEGLSHSECPTWQSGTVNFERIFNQSNKVNFGSSCVFYHPLLTLNFSNVPQFI